MQKCGSGSARRLLLHGLSLADGRLVTCSRHFCGSSTLQDGMAQISYIQSYVQFGLADTLSILIRQGGAFNPARPRPTVLPPRPRQCTQYKSFKRTSLAAACDRLVCPPYFKPFYTKTRSVHCAKLAIGSNRARPATPHLKGACSGISISILQRPSAHWGRGRPPCCSSSQCRAAPSPPAQLPPASWLPANSWPNWSVPKPGAQRPRWQSATPTAPRGR